MKSLIAAITLSAILLLSFGCDFPEGMSTAAKIVYSLDEAMVTANPIVALLEKEVPGWEGMSEDKKVQIINTCLSVEGGATKASGIAQAIGAFFPAAKPVTDGAVQVMLLLSTLAGGIGAFVKNRKAKKTEAVAIAAMKAGDEMKDYGKTVVANAAKSGVLVEANKIYKENIAQ